jgi:hypothetical protein
MILTKYKTINAQEAERLDMIPITRGYSEEEYPLLERAIATLGSKKYVLIEESELIAIARPRREINVIIRS